MAYVYYAPAKPPTYTLALSQSRAACGTITPPAIDLTLHHHPRLCEETLCKSSHLRCPPSISAPPLEVAPSPLPHDMPLSPPMTRTPTPTMTPCTRQSEVWSTITLHSYEFGIGMPQIYRRPLEERRSSNSLKDSVKDRVRGLRRGVKGMFVRRSMRV